MKREEVDSEIQIQKAFKEPVEQEYFYSVSETDDVENAVYLSLSTQAGNELSPGNILLSRYWSTCSWTLRRRP